MLISLHLYSIKKVTDLYCKKITKKYNVVFVENLIVLQN
jgi:hypothetical protein